MDVSFAAKKWLKVLGLSVGNVKLLFPLKGPVSRAFLAPIFLKCGIFNYHIIENENCLVVKSPRFFSTQTTLVTNLSKTNVEGKYALC